MKFKELISTLCLQTAGAEAEPSSLSELREPWSCQNLGPGSQH